EQSINEDFDVYSKQLEQIKILLETNRSEYLSLRKLEFRNQIASVENCIEKTIAKESELSAVVSNAKADFNSFRTTEFTEQCSNISQIVSQIDATLSINKDNPDLTNAEKVNGLGY